MERREPVIEEEEQSEPEPQPETASAGGVRPPGRIGSGLSGGSGGDDVPLFQLPIEALNLTLRARIVLRRSGFSTLGDVVMCEPGYLLSLQNFGVKSLDEVCERVADIVDARAPGGSNATEGPIIHMWLRKADAVFTNAAEVDLDVRDPE